MLLVPACIATPHTNNGGVEWLRLHKGKEKYKATNKGMNKYKDIIIESLHFCVKEGKVKLYAFVKMSNHIHLVWQPLHPTTKVKL